MADNVTADPASGGAVFATDEISSVHYPITKLTFGALDSQTIASSGSGVVDAGTQRVILASDQDVISTNWAGTSPPIGAGVEATALRVTVATDSTGVLTVDNAGAFIVQADSVIPGTGATNLGKAIDTAAGATDTGVAMLAVRDDEIAALTPVDGNL